MGNRDLLRSVETVSGRVYGPAPKRESLRSVERVRCEPPPPPPPPPPPLPPAKNGEAVETCAVSGAWVECIVCEALVVLILEALAPLVEDCCCDNNG
jgi:hypothetical protein